MVVNKNLVWKSPQFHDGFSSFYDVSGSEPKRIKSKGQAYKEYKQPSKGIERIVQDVARTDVSHPNLPQNVSAKRYQLETPEDRTKKLPNNLGLQGNIIRINTEALLLEEENEAYKAIERVLNSQEYKDHVGPSAPNKPNRMKEPNLFRLSLFSDKNKLKKNENAILNSSIWTPQGSTFYRVTGYNVS